MAINFTDSPADGATQVIGGRTYTYNSAKNKWDTTATEVVGPTATTYATVNDLPTSGVLTGDQAFVSGTNRLYIWNGSGWYNIALINTNPTISGVSSSYALATDGTATTVTITATDPEGLPITYDIVSDTSGNIATVTQGTGASSNVFTITPSTNSANAGTFSLTFRASDGVNIASAISSFTLQFTIPNSNYTTTLITSIGANNAVNNSFVDSSSSNLTITPSGNATQTTFSPYRHAGNSVLFDGSGDYLTIPAIQLGTSPFTIEMWVNLSTVTTSSNIPFLSSGTSSTAGTFQFEISSNSKLGFQYDSAGTFTTAAGLTADTWHHVAIVREGTGTDETKLYLDGVLAGSATIASDFNSTANIFVARNRGNSTYANGYITDVRVVSGTAVYTSAFTPPTEPLTAIANTSLLACQLPYFGDSSTNNHTITRNGNPSIQPFTPYVHGGYDSAEHSGSIYLDGNGAYLATPSSAAFTVGTGDFTLELWTYYTASPGNYTFLFGLYDGTDELAIRTGDGGFGYRVQAVLGSGASAVYDNTSYTTSYLLNKWTHLAFCRSGTTVTFYIDGTAVATKTSAIDVGLDSDGARIGAGAPYTPNAHVSGIRFLNGTALYTSDFTPPTAPPTAITNTTFLLNGINASIIDKSQSVKALTLNGDVKSSTTQTKYLTSSMYFDGTGDYIEIPHSPVFDLPGDFTIEFWAYFNALSSNPVLIDKYDASASGWQIYYRNTGSSITFYTNTVVLQDPSSSNITTNQWHHIAVSRTGSTIKLFVDGIEVDSATYTTSFTTTVNTQLGRQRVNNSNYINAYLSDVRITKGLGRYTANFTPPTAALEG